MAIVYIILSIIISIFITVLYVYHFRIKPLKKQILDLKYALESKQEADKERKKDEKEIGRIEPEKCLINNFVIKTVKTKMGRRLTEYKLNNIPEFENIDEVIEFEQNLINQMKDPSILNLSPYGFLMSSDEFMAFKVIMQYILEQVKKFSKSR